MQARLRSQRLAWRTWVTPSLLKTKPIHRWYVFPHSFTSELVHGLIAEWGLSSEDRIIDPFVGAGTTLLAAKEKAIPATGYDLSPLAVLASRVKTANFRISAVEQGWQLLHKHLSAEKWKTVKSTYPELVEQALPERLLAGFDCIRRSIDDLRTSDSVRDFFRLAMLRVLPKYSRAVATGGWLKWVTKRSRVETIADNIQRQVNRMLCDLRRTELPWRAAWTAQIADARRLPESAGSCSAVITSPPYPNRHDYTRVFGVELMLAFLDWEGTRQLRYQSFHSHPEARPQRPSAKNYFSPKKLVAALDSLKSKDEDPRVMSLLKGYFLDSYLVLREAKRVCKDGGHVAFVVGNAQYRGVSIPVDELVAELGEGVGLTCKQIRTVRYRGNSAQQMNRHGRRPARESIVIFQR